MPSFLLPFLPICPFSAMCISAFISYSLLNIKPLLFLTLLFSFPVHNRLLFKDSENYVMPPSASSDEGGALASTKETTTSGSTNDDNNNEVVSLRQEREGGVMNCGLSSSSLSNRGSSSSSSRDASIPGSGVANGAGNAQQEIGSCAGKKGVASKNKKSAISKQSFKESLAAFNREQLIGNYMRMLQSVRNLRELLNQEMKKRKMLEDEYE